MKIKNILYYTGLLLLSSVTTISCEDEYTNIKDTVIPSVELRYLGVYPNQFYVDYSESSTEINVINSTESSLITPWEFTALPSWINIDQPSGENSTNTIIRFAENTSVYESRAALFFLSSKLDTWSVKKPITVEQQVANLYITPFEREKIVDASAKEYEITVKSNIEWQAYTNANWINLITTNGNPGETSLKFQVSENSSTDRSGNIVISCPGLEEYIYILQKAGDITAELETITFDKDFGNKTFKIQSTTSWYATVSEYSTSWISITPTSGSAGENEITVSVTKNASESARNGYIYLNINEDQKLSIPVEQGGISLSAELSETFVNSSTGELTLAVYCNDSWELILPDWIKSETTEGEGDANIRLTYEDNDSTEDRKGDIIVQIKGNSINRTFTITQKGKEFSSSEKELSFNSTGGTASVEISADDSWTATTNEDWISISPASGTGSSNISITVQDNPSISERNGNVKFTFLSKEINLAITQYGKYIKLPNVNFDVNSKGSELSILISGDSKWSATLAETYDWINIINKDGNANEELRINVADNPTVTPRSAKVKLDYSDSEGIYFFVNQSCRYLKLTHNRIYFMNAGGESSPIGISTDGTFTVETNVDWLTINRNGNEITISASTNNTGKMRTGTATVKLTDLTSGELKEGINIMQISDVTYILKGEYEELENNWTGSNSSQGDFNKGEYDDQNNWNNNTTNNNTINKGDYDSTDSNWNN